MEISYDELLEIAEEAGLDEAHVYAEYSGRGMHGSSCIGFSLDSTGDLIHMGAAIQTILGADALNTWGRPSTDSLGRGLIAYWPGITCPDPR